MWYLVCSFQSHTDESSFIAQNAIELDASSFASQSELHQIHPSQAGWQPETSQEGEWFIFDFGDFPQIVSASTTWGKEDVMAWVTLYSLDCALTNNTDFKPLLNTETGETTFEGNSNATASVSHALFLTQCQVVKLNVLEFDNFVALRWRITFCHGK